MSLPVDAYARAGCVGANGADAGLFVDINTMCTQPGREICQQGGWINPEHASL